MYINHDLILNPYTKFDNIFKYINVTISLKI